MLGRSHKLSALVTAAAAAVAAAAFAIPASADSGSCTPPAGADGWYCAALSMNNAGTANGVTDRLVDDYFRDPPARTSTCTPPAGADGWYCAALSMNNAGAAKGVTGRLVDGFVAMSAPTSEGIVDDSWRSPFAVEGDQQSSGGFNWGDFAIGVAVAFGAMLLAMGVSKRVKGQQRLGIGRA